MNIITTKATTMYVASWTESVQVKEIAFMFQILGTNEQYLVTIRQIEEYLEEMSAYFDGHWYYTNAGKVIRDVVSGKLPTEELAITLLEGGSCVHVGDKLEFNTPQNTNIEVYQKIQFQSRVIRIFASYIAAMYASKTKVLCNGLDAGGFILRLNK